MSSRSILFITRMVGRSATPSSPRRSSTACLWSSIAGWLASTTCSRTSASASSSSVARTPRRARAELADESDGIGQDEAPAAFRMHQARGRIEGHEQLIGRRELRAREPVQQGRLAGVRVADERDDGHAGSAAALALQTPMHLHAVELPANLHHLLRMTRRSDSSWVSPGPVCRCRRRDARGASTDRPAAARDR